MFVPHESGISIFDDEHDWQKMRPHARQWCFLRLQSNERTQAGQRDTALSSSHWGGSEASGMYDATGEVGML